MDHGQQISLHTAARVMEESTAQAMLTKYLSKSNEKRLNGKKKSRVLDEVNGDARKMKIRMWWRRGLYRED
jgi:hypothetical protein